MSISNYRDYFLGLLLEKEAAEIELRLIEDMNFAARLLQAEEDLIEDYLDSQLTLEAEEHFRTNYLITDERTKNVEIVRLLKLHGRKSQAPMDETEILQDTKKTLHLRWFTDIGVFGQLAVASVVLIAVSTVVWWSQRNPSNNDLVELQDRYELLNQDSANTELDPNVSEVTLISGNLRSSDGEARIVRSRVTANVRFRIALPAESELGSGFLVILFRGNNELFRLNQIRPIPNPSGSELRLLFPGEILESGSYRITLQNEKMQSISYPFTVAE